MASEAAGEGASALQPSFGRPGSEFVYRLKELGAKEAKTDAPCVPIMVPDTSIYMLFAHRQWRAGMLLADAIYSCALDVRDKYVLELGAGTGLPALTAALCGAPHKVVVTDYDDAAIVAALRRNLMATKEANKCSMAPTVVAGHTWGQAMDDVLDLLPPAHSHFDVILLADCVWERFSHDVLLRSIKAFLARTSEARVYMVAGLHTGRHTLVHFFRQALAVGLQLVPVPGTWPACAPEATSLPGSEHVLELEVGGAWTHDESPHLTGECRAFVLHRGAENEDEPIQVRNHWLTVSCFAWAA